MLETMKAAYCSKYGDPEVIDVREIPKPTSPKSGEILIRIHSSSVTAADTFMRQGSPKFSRLFLGWSKPKHPVLGTGFSGEIVEIGECVKKFQVGDYVFGESIFGSGTNTEYICIKETALVLVKPKNVHHSEAATLTDGFLTSYSFLKDIGKLEKGQRILINGASGSLGLAAVQLSKLMGAYVVGVCSAKNALLVEELGADEVVDYKTEDFTQLNHSFDLIYDAVGKSSYGLCKPILDTNGKYLSPVLSPRLLVQSIYTSLFSKKKAVFSATGMRSVNELFPLLEELSVFLSQNKIGVVIDKVYGIEDVIQAHRYVDSGRKVGNVVVYMLD